MLTTRAVIAAALSTVAGVTGRELRPAVPEAGDAWAVLAGFDRGEGQAWSVTWRILVTFEGDEEPAIVAMDAQLPDLVDALSAVVFVDHAEPVTIDTTTGSLLALELRGLSE
jgi:hypothetical protein